MFLNRGDANTKFVMRVGRKSVYANHMIFVVFIPIILDLGVTGSLSPCQML